MGDPVTARAQASSLIARLERQARPTAHEPKTARKVRKLHARICEECKAVFLSSKPARYCTNCSTPASQRAYREKNAEKVREWKREDYQRHKAQYLVRRREYYLKNKAAKLAWQRSYYQRNRERMMEAQRRRNDAKRTKPRRREIPWGEITRHVAMIVPAEVW